MATEKSYKGWPKSYAVVDVVAKGIVKLNFKQFHYRVFKNTLNTGPMYKFHLFPVADSELHHTEFRQSSV